MDWLLIVFAVIVLGGVGLIFGIILTAADKKLAVEVDPRIAKLRNLLGGANCGACGYTGCDAFAEAVIAGTAKPNACPAASVEGISEVLGLNIEAGKKMTARVICQGHDGVAKERYVYDGYRNCAIAATLAGGPKMCSFACIGFGDCIQACAFNAITIKNGLAQIDESLCVACGNCVSKCPRSAIMLTPTDARTLVLCRNSAVGRDARAQCMKACIACKRCLKECKYDAIEVTNGYARIDMHKCTRCGECAKVCPLGCIVDLSEN